SDLQPASSDEQIVEATNKTVLPGFIDSHTHLISIGSREAEFEQRLQGKTYQQIAAAGGGIHATVRRVREASKEDLKAAARKRLERLMQFGVTTVEVKSGYGLTLRDELKSLEVLAELNSEGPCELVPTFLGAHAVPPEFQTRRADYVQQLTDIMLPEIARRKLAEFCDVFCDVGAFDLAETQTIVNAARSLGFRVKLHADELSSLGGAELAARMQAVSADHLLCVTDAGIDAMAKAGTIATLLPGTA